MPVVEGFTNFKMRHVRSMMCWNWKICVVPKTVYWIKQLCVDLGQIIWCLVACESHHSQSVLKDIGRIWPTHLIFFIARFSLHGSDWNLVQTLPNWDGFRGKIDLKSILKLFRTVFLVFWEDDELKCLFRNSIFIFGFCVHISHYQLVGNTIFELKTTFKLSISTNYSFSE